MNKIRASFFIIIVTAAAAFPSHLFLPDFKAGAGAKTDYAMDEISVKYRAGASPVSVKLAPGENFYEILDYYRGLPEVEYAEPDYIYQASILPSDNDFNNQWYLQKIKATLAWNDVRESPDTIIAVLDSGVQIGHPDLQSNIWANKKEIAGNGIDDDKNGFIDDVNGWDFVNNAADPSPKFQADFTLDGIMHGTIVAGIAAAAGNNAAGVAGITWKAKIMPLKVLDDKGEGSASKVVKAIDYAVANGADIINLSFTSFGYSRGLDDAIKRAYDAGVIVVAAGGNEAGQGEGYNLSQTPMYPACNDGNGQNRVIGVAATDAMDQKAAFSSFGGCIDLAAPGVSIFSTVVYSPENSVNGQPLNKYYDGYWSGTSAAVPIVSGALALLESANPSLSRDEIVGALLNNTDSISFLNPNYPGQLGHGRINVASAVKAVLDKLKNKTERLVISPLSGKSSLIKITNQDGAVFKEFYAYAPNFKGGASFAAGDINGDGRQEIIVAAGPGGGPHIRIFNADGELMGQFMAFDKNFRGGVKIAAADVNHDGKDEIIAVQASAGNSEIKMFKGNGALLGSFYAYDNKFRGGLNIAAGDIDGDGEAEIITGLEAGKIPEVRIFKAIGVLQGQFLAYAKTFRGGVRVAVARAIAGSGRRRDQIIIAPGQGGGPQVKVFDNKGILLSQFFAYNSNFRGGVGLGKADVDNDGLDEIITAAGPGGAPHVRVFKSGGKITGSFYAYEENFSGGVNAGSIIINK